jgi:hypothetical protein
MEHPGCVALLKEFGSVKGKRVETCQIFDSNVSTYLADQSTEWLPRLISGFAFSHQIHMTHHRRRVHIAASEEYVSLQVEGRLNVGQCSINRGNRVCFVDMPTVMTVSGDRRWPIFVPRNRPQGEALSTFLDLPSLHAIVEHLIKFPNDSLHIFKDSICAYFHPDSVEVLQSAIESIGELVGVKTRISRSTLRSLPPQLQPLIPSIQKWAEDDDSWRAEMLSRASRSDIEKLIETVSPYLGQIDDYLATNDDEAACALGALAEVTAEARLEIANRKL